MSLLDKDIISMRDLSKDQVTGILERARHMDERLKARNPPRSLAGRMIASLFFEPSTRTRLSFETAAKCLGGMVTGFSSPKGTSVEKGETLSDTIRTVEQYADAIVMRHPYEGAARLASEAVSIPVVNGGDGSNQHPTQTLLDLYTIWKHKGTFDLKVALVGDLKHARTTRSLAYALGMFGADVALVAPKGLEMSAEVVDEVRQRWGTNITKAHDPATALGDVDAAYVVRIQKERFADPLELERLQRSYRITRDTLASLKSDAIIMHPLPRVDEVDTSVDRSHHAVYFDQAYNGVPVRMAVLEMLINGGDA